MVARSAPTGGPRIAFVINSLGYGGAERVLAHLLAAGLTRSPPPDLHLILLDDEPQRRDMPRGVAIHVLNARGGLRRSVIQLDRVLARLKPQLCVSLLVRANVAAALAGPNRRTPTVLCERMHLSSHLAGRYRGLKLWAARLAPRLSYRRADRVLGVSTGVTEDLVAQFGVRADRAVTLFNPYDLEGIVRAGQAAPEIKLPTRFAVAVARLDPAKNLLQLIDAFLDAYDVNSGVDLVILGEGPERRTLQAHIEARRAKPRIHLVGHLDNPFAVVARAELYVSASLNEGFPNAMVEAMALGVPVVASDCRSGPAEILAGEARGSVDVFKARYGVLVREGSLQGLTEGLRSLSDPAAREAFGRLGVLRAADFSLATVAEQYWSLFDRLVRPAPDRTASSRRPWRRPPG